MLSYDYFMQTNQMLTNGKRFKEMIDLCEYAISSAVWPMPLKRQCEALCRWTLAETYYFQIGDAKRARESYISFLKYVDNDMSMITEKPSLQEVMEDMYVKACVDMGQLAISYDEYFFYIKKSTSVRPLTQKQKGQMDNVAYNQIHGVSWCSNIMQLAELESDSIKSGAIDRLPCAAATYALLLIYPETEPPTDILRIAINNYSTYVCDLIGESILHCAAKKHPANPDNYRFIFEQAIDLVGGEFLEDMETRDIAEDAQKKMVEARSESIDKSNFYRYGYDSIAPAEVPDFIPPLILKEQIKQNLSRLPNSGCMVAFAIPMLSLGGIIAVVAIILTCLHG